MLAQAISVTLERPDDFDGWRDAARACLMAGLPPDAVSWAGDLFASAAPIPPPAPDAEQPKVSRAFLQLAQTALIHSEPQRFDLLYRLLWRLQRDPRLLEDHADLLIRRLEALAREVRRDIHKMRAFVRFRAVEDEWGERFVAWFEPEHHILRRNAGFFVNRFASMRWSILTPRGSLDWDGEILREGPPARRGDAPQGDPTEALWRDYYAATFNPARLKIGAMLKEMPRKYWKNMPETALIPQLVAGARARELAMVDAGSDLFADAERAETLDGIAEAIQRCRRCPIGCNGTNAVGGEGTAGAALMVVGEQPGDVEETQGRPFVGPAGRVLMEHLDHAGIDRAQAYVTNAVKHFKFEQRGKRRLHKTPTAKEIDICRFWLDGERALVKTRVILALGASAARGVLGKTVSLEAMRGAAHKLDDGSELWVTNHPSYLLRLQDGVRHEAEQRFAADLAKVAGRL
ncbi:MAG: UdgX family uracil-DNA binding protein [Candidatus Andeanibacterium colombiense]|uniref:Type-4 uracil-DNA glycosylase n=1 Tax=Candidatus Andeanibacterium colombiense TaxID=3121345 RepID=A0AAJ5X988_9SPHN|nr:MAG: UdgX family uracil-DNA binding protein [Sphingomonadaceae bacterium]